MIVTFPHMGNLSIALKAIFTGLGCTVLTPPPVSKRTLALGVKHAPETVCLPFKVTLGNFIEALELGADTLITCGGVGPCRLGYYAEVQQGILRSLGYDFTMVVFEPNLPDVLHSIRRLAPRLGLWQVYQAFRLGLAKMNALDDLERQVSCLRAREAAPGSADAVWQDARQAIDGAADLATLKRIRQDAAARLAALPVRAGPAPLRIGIVGEIYVMLEPFVNLDLVRRLGSMGVEVHQTMYLSDYVNGHLFRRREYLDLFHRLATLAQPYLGHYVGGHGLKSVAYTLHMGQSGYDGLIHVFPFTCMPEVVAKNILPKAASDAAIPVLSLAFDEQSGEAGIVTRLEAYVDLLRLRQIQPRGSNLKVLRTFLS